MVACYVLDMKMLQESQQETYDHLVEDLLLGEQQSMGLIVLLHIRH